MRAAREAGRLGDFAVALGTASLVHLSAGAPLPALEVADRALDIFLGWEPRASLRTQAYRVLALARLGRVQEAEAVLVEALRDAGDDRYTRRAEGWMRAYLAGALLEQGRPERALDVLSTKTIADGLRRESDLAPLARLYSGEALSSLGETQLAIGIFERVPAETGTRTPFQDRRVSLTQLRRARLLAREGSIAAAEACLAQALPPLALSADEELRRLRGEILEGRSGEATAAVASRCVRPWEPLTLEGSA